MTRLRDAWRVLTGKAYALDVSELVAAAQSGLTTNATATFSGELTFSGGAIDPTFTLTNGDPA